jgi:hypothetical protein
MDAFIKRKKQNLSQNFTDLGRCVCVIGKSGVGKTWAVHHALGGNYISLTEDILKSKQSTLDFLERLCSTDTPVVLDEYEALCHLVGLREITKPPSRGKFIIISQIPIENKFDFEIVIYNFPVPTFEEMKKIAPGASDSVIYKANGDVRRVLQSLEFQSDDHDNFMSPKDFITSLVSKDSTKNPMDYLCYHMSEPGNMVGILQENYLDAKGVDILSVTSALSDSQFFEDKMYDGAWDLMPYYSIFGCITPALEIGHRLNPNKMRPGSVWTKYQNMCMRDKRIKTIANRLAHTYLDHDMLLLLRKYIEHGQFHILRDYLIEAKDIDVLNHLSLHSKLKPKIIQDVKKFLNAQAPSTGSSAGGAGTSSSGAGTGAAASAFGATG